MTIVEWEFRPENRLRSIVPRRYWRRTGLDRYQFRVHSHSTQLVRYWLTPEDCARKVDLSAVCVHVVGHLEFPTLVSVRTYEVLAEAILALASISLDVRPREYRYLLLYRVYESLVDKPDRRFAAIRHALAHPRSLLTSAATIEALTSLFAGKVIDLRFGPHLTLFYVHLARMLIRTDERLGKLLDHATRLPRMRSLDDALDSWRVEDAGSLPAIPLCEETGDAR